MKEFQDKLNTLIGIFPSDGSFTGASLSWSKDEVTHGLGIQVNGGGASISVSYSAYKPTPTPVASSGNAPVTVNTIAK